MQHSAGSEGLNPDLRDILVAQAQPFPLRPTLALALMLLLTVGATFAQGLLTGASLLSSDAGGAQFWLFLGGLTVLSGLITGLTTWMLSSEHRRHKALGYPYEDDDTLWTLQHCGTVAGSALLSGFVSGLLGVPNSLFLAPAFVLLNTRAEVASATSSLLLVFAAVGSCGLYAWLGLLEWGYAVWFAVWAGVGALGGVFALETGMKRLGKGSVAGYYLALVLALHVILVLGYKSLH